MASGAGIGRKAQDCLRHWSNYPLASAGNSSISYRSASWRVRRQQPWRRQPSLRRCGQPPRLCSMAHSRRRIGSTENPYFSGYSITSVPSLWHAPRHAPRCFRALNIPRIRTKASATSFFSSIKARRRGSTMQSRSVHQFLSGYARAAPDRQHQRRLPRVREKDTRLAAPLRRGRAGRVSALTVFPPWPAVGPSSPGPPAGSTIHRPPGRRAPASRAPAPPR